MKYTLFMEQRGYTFQKNLGEGRYGKVVQAYSSRKNKTFAVKIIDLKKADSSYVEKFLSREKEIMRSVDHPNVIKTFSIFEQDSKKVYVVMEQCVNGDLSQHIKNKGPLTEEASCKFFVQLCAAVQYLHSKEITHRDLKCDNLLLDHTMSIKVCDFGLSKRITYTDGRMDLSETYCGTSNYASPELLRFVPYDPKAADVWSMGIVLYKMLYAALPFDATNVKRMVQEQMRHSIDFPDTRYVSPQAISLIQNILHPNVEHRISISSMLQSPWVVQVSKNISKDDLGQKKEGQDAKDLDEGSSAYKKTEVKKR